VGDAHGSPIENGTETLFRPTLNLPSFGEADITRREHQDFMAVVMQNGAG
jgi:hypothetical protein